MSGLYKWPFYLATVRQLNHVDNNKWDLPTVIILNARFLSCEKMGELQMTVETYNASIACVAETRYKEYIKQIHCLNMEWGCLERNIQVMVSKECE